MTLPDTLFSDDADNMPNKVQVIIHLPSMRQETLLSVVQLLLIHLPAMPQDISLRVVQLLAKCLVTILQVIQPPLKCLATLLRMILP
jgi:hypothetical protein